MIRNLILLAILGTAVAIAIGFFGFIHPAFDTIANFRSHLIFLFFILVIVLSATYRLRWVFISLVVAVPGMAVVYIVHSDQPLVTKLQYPDRYSLLHLNLYYQNPTPDKVLSLIDRTSPDIVLLNEMSQSWKQQLKGLVTTHPYTYYCPEWQQIGGSKIFSRFPIVPNSQYCHSKSAMAMVDLILDDQILTIGSVHLRWPWPASGPRQVDQLKPVLSQLGDAALIAGDFNSVKWSWLVRRFAKYGDLRIVQGIGPTWFHHLLPIQLARPFGLPIDNVMAKGRISVFSATTQEAVGSDHLPVFVSFSVKE